MSGGPFDLVLGTVDDLDDFYADADCALHQKLDAGLLEVGDRFCDGAKERPSVLVAGVGFEPTTSRL
jgi:hypothetical protein